MLNEMRTTYLKDSKGKFLIMFEEWDLPKMFVDEFFTFSEAIEIFFKLKVISLPMLLLFLNFC